MSERDIREQKMRPIGTVGVAGFEAPAAYARQDGNTITIEFETREEATAAYTVIDRALSAPKAEAGAVKPLEWKLSWGPYDDGDECHTAFTPFGSYSVKRIDGGWVWGFCFDEYYDEDEFDCADIEDGKRSAEAHWQERCSDIVSASPVPAITDDARVKQLEAEKSILMGAIAFAIEADEPDTFLRCFTDGSADEDEEWKDWQEFKANLVLNGNVAKQAFPELPAITDEAVERAVRGWFNCAEWEEGLPDGLADATREDGRFETLAAFPSKGEGE